MNPCNVDQLIDRAAKTGSPITVSSMFVVSNLILKAPVIDLAPINSNLSLPQSISHLEHCDTSFTFGQVHAPFESNRHVVNSSRMPAVQL